jgi:hypothetical protein
MPEVVDEMIRTVLDPVVVPARLVLVVTVVLAVALASTARLVAALLEVDAPRLRRRGLPRVSPSLRAELAAAGVGRNEPIDLVEETSGRVALPAALRAWTTSEPDDRPRGARRPAILGGPGGQHPQLVSSGAAVAASEDLDARCPGRGGQPESGGRARVVSDHSCNDSPVGCA